MNVPKLKRWHKLTYNGDLANELQHKLKISPLIAKILVNRGLNTVEEAQLFLAGDVSSLGSPLQMTGMIRSVNKIKEVIKNKAKVLVYGDYDVDGITSTALLYELLKKLGANVGYHIPERLVEGYGLNFETIKRFGAEGYQLIITVDCGISSVDEVKLANELAIEVIITDHHEPPVELPKAYSIINPKLDGGKVFDKLAGVGVAFKLAQAIHLSYGLPEFEQVVAGEYLDLVALGTI
ncbi:MAG: DHH family phosphoesterase, partial [Bacillota bacterium]|nr:DHH family phosphoesterase [Bacillota bacterium]